MVDALLHNFLTSREFNADKWGAKCANQNNAIYYLGFDSIHVELIWEPVSSRS